MRHFPAFNRVGFFLNETPQRVTSRPVSIICAGDTLSEVGRLTSPGEDNFRIDYGNVANFAQVGFVELNSSRIGQIAVINYRGLGVNLNASLLDDATPNIQRSVSTPANVTARGLSVTGSLSFIPPVLSAGMQRIRDLSSVSANDIINISKFLGLTGRSAPRILTGSGYWQKPANVKNIFFVLIGPGGSGHVDGGGGGGGASVYGVADLEAIGGDMFAYVCGVVGIATTMFGCVAGSGSSASGAIGAIGGTGSIGSGVVGGVSSGGSGGSGFYMAVAASGTGNVMTSPDGITWTARAVAENNQWLDIIFGGGVIVAVANSGTHRIMTTADGLTWTAITAPENNDWRSLAYGNGIFVAVSQDGTNRVMTSPDGITWTARAAAENNQWNLTFANGQFVAVAATGTNRVMTSPDGITWTLRSAAENNEWQSVQYCPSGGGGNGAGGFGIAGSSAVLGSAGDANGFFQGKGGSINESGQNYGGGAGADGTGADGLILLVY